MTPIEVLEQCILDLAPNHYACENAPNDYKSLMNWYNNNNSGVLPVFNGSSDKTIYSSDRVNFAFRAWHDAIHIAFKLDFSYADELEVAKHHVDELLCWCIGHGIDGNLAYDAAELVYADVVGQVEYYYHHKKYVDNQLDFVVDYIVNDFNLPAGVY